MAVLKNMKRASRLVALSTLSIPLLYSLEAQAGFQWITPVDQAPLATAPVHPAGKNEPSPPKDKAVPAQIQLPTTSETTAVQTEVPPLPLAAAEPLFAAPSPVPPTNSVAPVVEPVTVPVETSVVAPATVPPAKSDAAPVVIVVDPAAVPAADAPAPVKVDAPQQTAKLLTDLDAGKPVEGFGRSIPLSLALKQLLPVDHVFAFESGVSPSQSVTWEGGKGWRVVVANALQPAGLVGYETGNVVTIAKAAPEKAAAMVAPAAIMETPVQPETLVSAPVETVAPVQLPNAVQETVVTEPVQQVSNNDESKPVVTAPIVTPLEPATTTAPSTLPDVAGPDAEITTGKVVMPATVALQPPLLSSGSDAWRAEPGEHLRDVIKRWAKRAGVEVVWSTEYDYPVQASASFSGSFEEAVRDLLSGFVDAKPQPFGRLHDNPSVGQRILVIQTRGNTNGE